MAVPSSHGQLSYAELARKAQAIRSPIQIQQRTGPPSPSKKSPPSDQKPHKSVAVNVWDRRKEELAARSQSRVNIPPGPSEDDDDDDPFVVRSSRARPHVPVTTESPEDWPEVGKSIQSSTADESRPANGGQSARKGAPKWIPLQLQPPVEVQSQHYKEIKSNRQSINSSRPPSNHGQGRNSRNHSSRNSANHSRIHSNEGSAHSSPRNPRNRRLPADEPSSVSNSNSHRLSRTGSPSHVQTPSDIPTHSAYYSQPLVNSIAYHSPSHPPHPSLPPADTPLPPMLPQSVHGYSYPYQYISYGRVTASAPYPYWNGHQGSHPGSGTHSPAYPPSAMLYPVLPVYVQQHLQSPPMQPQSSTYSHSSSRDTSSKATPASSSPGTTTSSVAMPSQSSAQMNGSMSVVFGSIESQTPSLPSETAFSPSTSSVVDDSSVERMFKTLAIGVDSSTVPKSRKSANKSVKEKEVIADGEITVDPAIVKEAEAGSSGDVKWKFGNEGLVHHGSPARCITESVLPDASVNVESSGHDCSPPAVDEGPGEYSGIKNFEHDFETAAGKTISADVPTDEVEVDAPTEHLSTSLEGDVLPTTLISEYPSQPGPSNDRPRRGGFNKGYGGYDRGGYTSERRRGRSGGINGYSGRGGYSRGYAGRGSGNHHHHYNSYNMYQPRHQVSSPAVHIGAASFSATSPTFQGLPPSHHPQPSHVDYYLSPASRGGGRGGMATYIPIGYEPYPPPPPPVPLSLHGASSSSAQAPLQLSQSSAGHAGHGHVAPPMPMPMSQIGFPLDSTRYYLLGQLEYYLSPQNMAQDLFLRRRMDSRGWIEIDLLASFNRVKQLTSDHQLVREVLMLSTLVQVREGYVRMGGWERFVLPDAVMSAVEGGDGNDLEDLRLQQQQEYPTPSSYDLQSSSSVGELRSEKATTSDSVPGVTPPSQDPQQWDNQYSSGSGCSGEEELEYAEEEEDEDDVVFVMGQNGGEDMWSHEKRAAS